ncbi:MAG: NACHT domain-containing protein [Desulfuromonadaceae bacterium]|nr:NACHT domain-containing protein [Desulfuromonadaceae bacterium]
MSWKVFKGELGLADNTLSEKNGGKWALSGFFYQAVGAASLVARAHNLRDQGMEGDDLDAMVEIGGLIPEASYDQDAILYPVNGMPENQCAFYQFKYSGSASGAKLRADSFKDIVAAFVKGSQRAISDGFTVFRYVLVTNREISGTVRSWIAKHEVDNAGLKNIVDLVLGDQAATSTAPERVQIENYVKYVLQHFHPPVIPASLSYFWRELTLYGERLGLSPDLINNGIFSLIGAIFKEPGMRIDKTTLNRALTLCESPCELTVKSIRDNYPPDVSPLFRGELQKIVDRESVAGKLNSLVAAGKQLIVLIGRGGTGKSSYLAKWVIHSLQKHPEAMIEVKHACCLSDNWIAKTIADWSGVLLCTNSSNTDALKRLRVANGSNPHKLYLILDGIDETGNDATNSVRKFLDEFNKSPSNAVLIVTCRDKKTLETLLERTGGSLKDDLSNILVNVEFFDNNEFANLVMGMSDSIAKEKLLGLVMSNLSNTYVVNPGYRTGGDNSNELLFGDVFMGTPGPSDWERVLFDSLHHPVLWSVFAKMNDIEQEELINNMSVGYSSFGHGILDWFTKKMNWRHAGPPIDKTNLKDLLNCISHKTATCAVHSRAVWISSALDLRWELTPATLTFNEAISAGLIEIDDAEKWKWSNQLICKSFAALGAETEVETL